MITTNSTTLARPATILKGSLINHQLVATLSASRQTGGMRTNTHTFTGRLSLGIRIGLLVASALIISTSVAQTSLEEWLQILEEALDESEQRALAEMLLVVRISATDLVVAYTSNADVARQRYDDIPLEVTGRIGRIARSFFQYRFIELAPERGSGVVSCYFRDRSDVIDQYLARFEPDQVVTLRGANQGWNGAAVDLHDCVVVSAEAAATAPVITTEEPAAVPESAADPESPPLCAELDSLESFEAATLDELDRCLGDAGIEVPVTPDLKSPAPAVAPEIPTPEGRQQALAADSRVLEEAVRNAFGGDLISVEVSEGAVDLEGNLVEGEELPARIVDVVFRGSDLILTRITKSGIELDMARGYRAIFTSGVPVRVASIEAHMPLRDRSGNTRLGPVYGTHLWYEPRTNWENIVSDVDLLLVVPELWDVYLLNREFQDR